MRRNKKLLDAIQRDGRTAGEIATAAGVSGCTLSLIVNRHRTARLDTAHKLASALHTTPDAIGLPTLADVKIGGVQ